MRYYGLNIKVIFVITILPVFFISSIFSLIYCFLDHVFVNYLRLCLYRFLKTFHDRFILEHIFWGQKLTRSHSSHGLRNEPLNENLFEVCTLLVYSDTPGETDVGTSRKVFSGVVRYVHRVFVFFYRLNLNPNAFDGSNRRYDFFNHYVEL